MKRKGTFVCFSLFCCVTILSQFIEISCEWLTFLSGVIISLDKRQALLSAVKLYISFWRWEHGNSLEVSQVDPHGHFGTLMYDTGGVGDSLETLDSNTFSPVFLCRLTFPCCCKL